MKRWRILLVALASAALVLGFGPGSQADNVTLSPGYIAGTVSMGNAFTTTSISLNAIGGGYSAYKTVDDSKDYSLTVEGGDWSYTVTASAQLSGGGGHTSVSFNPRTISVSPGQTVTNDYTPAAGIVRFHVNISGDDYTSWSGSSLAQKSASSGQEETSSKTYTQYFTTNGVWEMPVVANQQIKITAHVVINGTSYSFDLGYKQVSAGEVIDIPLNIDYVKPSSPPFSSPPAPPNYEVGSVKGTIWLENVDNGDFLRSVLQYAPCITDDCMDATSTINANPGPYHLDFYLLNGNSFSQTLEPKTYFTDGSFLLWPSNKNSVYIQAGKTKTLDLIGEAGKLTGKFDFSGAEKTAALSYYSLNITGTGYAGMSRTGAAVANPDYRLYLSEGPWSLVWVRARKDSPHASSYLSIDDYRLEKTPLYVQAGQTTVHDLDYCTGEVAFRFRDASGRPMRYPSVSGYGYRYDSSGNREFAVSVSGSNYSTDVQNPEVEIFGPPANYTMNMSAIAADGTRIYYPRMKKALVCGVKEIDDIPGPTLDVEQPASELITNADELNVSGMASGPNGIAQVTVIGQEASLTPGGTSSGDVAFSQDLSLQDGTNTITTVAVDTSGAQATDNRTVYVDRWIPQVSIASPVDGARFWYKDAVPVSVKASDQGYGYTLKVYLDGNLIHQQGGAANASAPAPLSYTGTLGPLPVGNHVLRAVVTDRAGNSASAQTTFVSYMDIWPPTVSILSPADGSFFRDDDKAIPVKVEAADRGAGYTLTVSLDGTVLYKGDGPVNLEAPASMSFSGFIGPLSLGEHHLVAVARDLAGHTATASATLVSYLPSEVIVKPESRNNKDKGTMTVFAHLPGGRTANASLAPGDTAEVTAIPPQHPTTVRYAAGADRLVLKFARTPELMADRLFTVRGRFFPNPANRSVWYYWQGSDTTKK